MTKKITSINIETSTSSNKKLGVIAMLILVVAVIGLFFYANKEYESKLVIFPNAKISAEKNVFVKRELMKFSVFLGNKNPRVSASLLEQLSQHVYAQNNNNNFSNETNFGKISVKATIKSNNSGNTVRIPINLSKDNKDVLTITADPTVSDIRPGQYHLEVDVTHGFSHQVITQDFLWGVLALNPNKAVYKPGETSNIDIAVLDNTGMMVCDAGLSLKIITPSGKEILSSTSNGLIIVHEVCDSKNFTLEPDYSTSLKLEETGIYKLYLSADTLAGSYDISDNITVTNEIPFDIQRHTATRIYPALRYPMMIEITPNEDFTGFVQERVPGNFSLYDDPKYFDNLYDKSLQLNNKYQVTNNIYYKSIVWQVNWKKGQTYNLFYSYDSPDQSPNLFVAGPLSFYKPEAYKQSQSTDKNLVPIYMELRQWQIAVDAVTDAGYIFYGDTANSIPNSPPGNVRTRVFTGPATWAGEIAASWTASVTSNNSQILWARAAVAPTREETMIGTLKYDGSLWVQKCTTGCDGTGDYSAQWNNPGTTPQQDCDNSAPFAQKCYRAFDIAYEPLSGRAMVAYGDSVADRVYYALFDGTSWSPNSTPGTPGATNAIDLPGAATAPTWIRLLAAKPDLAEVRSDNMMMLVADSGASLYGIPYTGGSFAAGTALASNLRNCGVAQCFDGAWSDTDQFVVTYHTSAANDTRFRFYTITSGTWSTENVAFTMAGQGQWYQAVASPSGYAVGIATAEVSETTRNALWRANGSTNTWTVCNITDCPDTSTEIVNGMQSSFAFQRSGENGIYTYNNAGTTSTNRYSKMTATATWSAMAGTGVTSSDDHLMVKAFGNPNNNNVLIVAEDVDCDISARLYNETPFGTQNNDLETAMSNYGGPLGSVCPEAADASAGDPAGAAQAYDFVFRPYSPWSRNWEFFSDITNNDPSTGYGGAGQNTAPSNIALDAYMRLRINMAELANNSETDTRKKLQYTSGCSPNTAENTCTWTDVGETTNNAAVWRYANNTETCPTCYDGQTSTTARLSGTNQSPAVQFMNSASSAPSTSFDHTALSIVEIDVPLKAEAVKTSTTYYFRLYEPIISNNGMDSPVFREQDNDGSYDCAGTTTCTYPNLSTATMNVSGTVYLANETTTGTSGNGGPCDGSTANVSLRVNGDTAMTTTCSNSDGSFTFNNVAATAGDSIAIYLTSTAKANRVYITDGATDTNQYLYINTVALSYEQGSAIAITDTTGYDATQDSTNMFFDSVAGSPNIITVIGGKELHISNGKTFTPNGKIVVQTTGNLHVDDNAILNFDTASNTIGNNLVVDTGATVNLNNTTTIAGTITTNGTGAITRASGTATTTVNGGGTFGGNTGTFTFYNLNVGNTAASTLSLARDLTVLHDLSVGGSSPTTFDVNTNDNNVHVFGNVSITANGIYSASSNTATPLEIETNFANLGIFTHNTGTILFSGTGSTSTVASGCTTWPACGSKSFYNMTVNKTSTNSALNDVSLVTNDIRINNTLTITSGRFVQGALNLQADGATPAINVSYDGTYYNVSTGDIYLGGTLTNYGAVYVQGTSSACGEADAILLRSTAAAQRAWNGPSNNYFINDVDAQYVAGDVVINAYSSTNTSNNGANWNFITNCLATGSNVLDVNGLNFGGIDIN